WETVSSGLKALKVPRDNPADPNDYMYVEWRQPIGYDTSLRDLPTLANSNVLKGVLLHFTDPFDATDSELIDPLPPADLNTVAVMPGQTFTDPISGTQFTIGTPGSTIPVTVTVGHNTDHTPPTTTVTSPAANATVSDTVAITSNSTDNTGIGMVEV